MPLYQYRCSSCGHYQETLSYKVSPDRPHCPICGHKWMDLVCAPSELRFKGDGWYVNDYGKKRGEHVESSDN